MILTTLKLRILSNIIKFKLLSKVLAEMVIHKKCFFFQKTESEFVRGSFFTNVFGTRVNTNKNIFSTSSCAENVTHPQNPTGQISRHPGTVLVNFTSSSQLYVVLYQFTIAQFRRPTEATIRAGSGL
jgi:hypothetical protein